jgi:hypothetical protein
VPLKNHRQIISFRWLIFLSGFVERFYSKFSKFNIICINLQLIGCNRFCHKKNSYHIKVSSFPIYIWAPSVTVMVGADRRAPIECMYVCVCMYLHKEWERERVCLIKKPGSSLKINIYILISCFMLKTISFILLFSN